MKKTPLEKNSAYILVLLFRDLCISLVESILLLARSFSNKSPLPLKENRLLDMMNFVLHTGPKSFWKSPSGIKIGRSISTLLHYVFEKDTAFKEQKR